MSIKIIDDSQPELTAEWWEGFDYPFFNQYGGLRIDGSYGKASLTRPPDESVSNECHVVESPFYYWSGGECPVPKNVEVEIEFIERDFDQELDEGIVRLRHILSADDVKWNDKWLLSFRLTGRIL